MNTVKPAKVSICKEIAFFIFLLSAISFFSSLTYAQTKPVYTYKNLGVYHDPKIEKMKDDDQVTALSTDGGFFAYKTGSDVVNVVETNSLKLVNQIPIEVKGYLGLGPKHEIDVRKIALSKGGKYLIVGGDDFSEDCRTSFFHVIDRQKYAVLNTLWYDDNGVSSITFSPNEKLVALALKKRIILFEAKKLYTSFSDPLADIGLEFLATGPYLKLQSNGSKSILRIGNTDILTSAGQYKASGCVGWIAPIVSFSLDNKVLYAYSSENWRDQEWLEAASWDITNISAWDRYLPIRVNEVKASDENGIVRDDNLFLLVKGVGLQKIDLSPRDKGAEESFWKHPAYAYKDSVVNDELIKTSVDSSVVGNSISYVVRELMDPEQLGCELNSAQNLILSKDGNLTISAPNKNEILVVDRRNIPGIGSGEPITYTSNVKTFTDYFVPKLFTTDIGDVVLVKNNSEFAIWKRIINRY